MQTMCERDDSQPLRGIVEVDDAYLGGEASGGKRGRGDERKTPFVAAAPVSADGRPERLRPSPLPGFRKRALQAWAEQHLQAGTLVRSDGLACLRGVQAAGCEHQAQVTGGGKGSCETPGLSWANTLLGNVKRAIDGTYHACDSRYAGRYLAEFVPLQSALRVSRSRSASRLCFSAHPAPDRPAPNSGWNCWVIRNL